MKMLLSITLASASLLAGGCATKTVHKTYPFPERKSSIEITPEDADIMKPVRPHDFKAKQELLDDYALRRRESVDKAAALTDSWRPADALLTLRDRKSVV